MENLLFLNQNVELVSEFSGIPAETKGQIIRDKQNGTYLIHFDFGFPKFQNYPDTECLEEVLRVYDSNASRRARRQRLEANSRNCQFVQHQVL